MSSDEYNNLLHNYLTPPSKSESEGQGFSGEGKSFIGTDEEWFKWINPVGNDWKNNGFNAGFNPNHSKSQPLQGHLKFYKACFWFI